jgi:transcriptional regulator with XRE-family HTH domain
MAKSIGEVLKEARKARGLSIYAVAEVAGVTPTTVSRIENRDSDDARFKTVVKLGAAVGLTAEEIAQAVGVLVPITTVSLNPVVVKLFDELRRLNQRLNALGLDASATLEAIRTNVLQKT